MPPVSRPRLHPRLRGGKGVNSNKREGRVTTEEQRRKDGAAAAFLAREMILQDRLCGPIVACLESEKGKFCPWLGTLERLEKMHSRLRRKPNGQVAKTSSHRGRRRRRRKRAKPETPITFSEWLQNGKEEKT